MSGNPVIAPAAVPLPGWYGKLPALGDFASRRLAPAFISLWDAWLQRGMAASRANLQGRWADVYLNGPLWNFILMPGVLGDTAWAGTMMPSVDKVGRHFPLTIALELAPQAELIRSVLAAQDWFAAIDQVALDSLNVDCGLDEFEGRLAATAFPALEAHRAEDDARRVDRWWSATPAASMALALSDKAAMRDLFEAAGLMSLSRAGAGRSLWWSEAAEGGAVRLLAFPGMPTERDFTQLLEGGP